MIIKPADDKRPQLAELQALANRTSIEGSSRKRIEQEIRYIQAGIRGEEEAAYEMKVHYGETANWMVLHDLRIEHGGLVAQIDHLIIDRCLEMWVCESKHFSEGVAVNEHGEFAAFFGGKPYGVPSPVEQNNRHMLILRRLFDAGGIKLPVRLGFTIKPELKSLVLVSKGARIGRPNAKVAGLDSIIKNDMLFKTISKSVDESSPLQMAKVVGQDTLETLARQIAALHRPIEINWAAKFGLVEPADAAANPMAPASPLVAQRVASSTPASAATAPRAEPQEHDARKAKQPLVCKSCASAVPYNVAKFCWFNKQRFGGNLYCMDCQKMHR